MIRDAHVDGENRFWLSREWSSLPRDPSYVVYVMLNPSTADAAQDDPTIRRCIGFATKLGYGRMYVVNLFSKRATNPGELRFGVGRWMTNLAAVRLALRDADAVVFAWGASVMRAPLEARGRALRGLADVTAELEIRPHCLGSTRDGHPRHPLMLPYSAALEPWTGVEGYDSPEWAFLK